MNRDIFLSLCSQGPVLVMLFLFWVWPLRVFISSVHVSWATWLESPKSGFSSEVHHLFLSPCLWTSLEMLCKAQMCLGSLHPRAFANCCSRCRTKRHVAGYIFPRQSFSSVSILVCFGLNHSRDRRHPVLQLSSASAAVAWTVGALGDVHSRLRQVFVGLGVMLQQRSNYLTIQPFVPSVIVLMSSRVAWTSYLRQIWSCTYRRLAASSEQLACNISLVDNVWHLPQGWALLRLLQVLLWA